MSTTYVFPREHVGSQANFILCMQAGNSAQALVKQQHHDRLAQQLMSALERQFEIEETADSVRAAMQEIVAEQKQVRHVSKSGWVDFLQSCYVALSQSGRCSSKSVFLKALWQISTQGVPISAHLVTIISTFFTKAYCRYRWQVCGTGFMLPVQEFIQELSAVGIIS